MQIINLKEKERTYRTTAMVSKPNELSPGLSTGIDAKSSNSRSLMHRSSNWRNVAINRRFSDLLMTGFRIASNIQRIRIAISK